MSEAQWQQCKANSPVRIQWDPERDLQLHAQKHRSVQIRLGKEAVQHYVSEWICDISKVTPLAKEIHALVADQQYDQAAARLPRNVHIPSNQPSMSPPGACPFRLNATRLAAHN